MSATQELIAAALRLAALAERNTDDRDEWQHAIDSVREACARAMVQPAAPDVVVRPGLEGWKGATIAWEVCASIHREYAKDDPFFTTRQGDFVKHAEAARAKALAPSPEPNIRKLLFACEAPDAAFYTQWKDGIDIDVPAHWVEKFCAEYGDAREAAGYAAGVAAERERCADMAWLHYMSTCRAKNINAGEFYDWCCASALRGEVKP